MTTINPESRERQPTRTVTLVVPVEVHATMRELARRADRTLAGEVRRALREYLDRQAEAEPEAAV